MISVSTIIITHGRLEILMKCLQSLRQLPEDLELIIVSNGEVLPDLAREFIAENFSSSQVVETPQRLSPGEARNLAISKARESEWLFFLDDDAYLMENYWELAQKYLVLNETEVLGGPDMAPKDMGYFAKAVATTLSSPFCTGLTFSRHYPLGKKLQIATEENLSSANLWIRKKCFDNLEFSNKYLRGEESLLLAKLTDMGIGIFYHPRLRIFHYRRNNLWAILQVNYKGGFYRARMMHEKVDFSWSYFLPSLFVILHLTSLFDMANFLELAKLYILIIACVSLGISQRQRTMITAPLVFLLHYIIVFTYGLGFIRGIIHRGSKN